MPKDDLITLRDEAARVPDLVFDIKYYQTENTRLKAELAQANSRIKSLENDAITWQENEDSFKQDIDILKNQIARFKKKNSKRFGVGGNAGIDPIEALMGNVRPRFTVGLQYNLFRF